jgi:hypothetical protein
MTRLSKFPWVSFVLLLLTYISFGWSYARWAVLTIENFKDSYWLEKINIDAATIDILGGFFLVSIVFVFTGAVALLTDKIFSWIKTQLQVFTSIIGGSLAVVLILYLFEYSVRFLVLLSAAMLFRLDLRNNGFKKENAAIILAIFSLSGFIIGVLSYTFLSEKNIRASLFLLLGSIAI